jgi:hypothetical protein
LLHCSHDRIGGLNTLTWSVSTSAYVLIGLDCESSRFGRRFGSVKNTVVTVAIDQKGRSLDRNYQLTWWLFSS